MTQETADRIIALIAIIGAIACMAACLSIILNSTRSKETVVGTPVTEEGLTQFDNLSPGEAVMMAWSEPGDNPHYHRMMQDDVRAQMPVLGRALDRMVEN